MRKVLFYLMLFLILGISGLALRVAGLLLRLGYGRTAARVARQAGRMVAYGARALNRHQRAGGGVAV